MTDGKVEFYQPEVVSAQDYYPFGQNMPERSYINNDLNNDSYRFGFNGKEQDNSGEFGSLTHYDYGFRIYNPAIGKFLSVDPLTAKYAMLTPYQFASDSPIANIDLDGLESQGYIYAKAGFYGHKPKVAVEFVEDVIKGVGEIAVMALGAITQIGDRVHGIGSEWEETQRLNYYSIIGDKSELELLVEVAASPIIAVNEYYNDPSDGKKLGHVLGTVAPFVKGRKLNSNSKVVTDVLRTEGSFKNFYNESGVLVNEGGILKGAIPLENTTVILEGKITISKNGKEVMIDNFSFFETSNFGEIKAQNTIGYKTTKDILNSLQQIVKEEGFLEGAVSFKRSRPEGSPLKDTEVRTIPLKLKD